MKGHFPENFSLGGNDLVILVCLTIFGLTSPSFIREVNGGMSKIKLSDIQCAEGMSPILFS